jgi:uncharacterized repeat protein (TIGR03803 family)
MRNARTNRGWTAVMSAVILMVLAVVAAPAQTFNTLVNFNGTNGSYPNSSFVQGTDGNLYGATSGGGANAGGTVLTMTPSGALTVLYSFCRESNCRDGEGPYTGPALGFDGNLYGTTFGGGSSACQAGCGTVYKITPAGKLTTLYSFGGTDGYGPLGLAQGTDGAFYGVTVYGGTGSCVLDGCGTVFRITVDGDLTVLHNFNGSDGAYAESVPVESPAGNFYGTTVEGGNENNGTVWELTASGMLTTLYKFCSQPDCSDGSGPETGLVRATNGNFYGTTGYSGSTGGGTLFELTPSDQLTTLYTFCSLPGCTDGSEPYTAPLIQGSDGKLYGTTAVGRGGSACSADSGCGTVFSFALGGTLTTLHSFDAADGSGPWATIYQDTNGRFYGTTHSGGTSAMGTIYELGLGLVPFVQTLPIARTVGGSVKILGTNLTGAISVSFNGTSATFKVVSDFLISTSVPTGATTGPVQVVTPSGTLTSNVNFQVEP